MDKIYRAWVHFCDMCGYRFIVNIEEDVIKDMICPGCQGKLKRRTSWIKEIVPGAVKKIKKEKNGGGDGIMANIKICSKCGKIGLDQCDFRLYWNRVGYYYKTECLECEAGKSLHHYYNNKEHCNEYSREYCNQWRIDNKEYKKEYDRSYYQNHKDKHKSRALNSRFNIGLKKYNTILKGQDFRCGICRTHISNLPISLAVDHNHTTGKVRGLLCGRCNLTLGMVYEDKELLLGMINYLDKWGDKKC